MLKLLHLEDVLERDELTAFNELFNSMNNVYCSNTYEKIGLLMQKYTHNLHAKTFYLDLQQSKFNISKKGYDYKSVDGVKIISLLYYIIKKTSSNELAQLDAAYEFVHDCILRTNFRNTSNKAVPIDIDFPIIRHWIKNNFFKKNIKYYLWCDEFGDNVKFLSPVKVIKSLNYSPRNTP
ncbi:Uncharacterised protein [Candidatus Tiddalikarchaeum anstoanum]|nr:Uncharacterised protein [Candidatus Tiddalikarchaeum anstoanum]